MSSVLLWVSFQLAKHHYLCYCAGTRSSHQDVCRFLCWTELKSLRRYLQRDPCDDIQRVDDVPEGLAHLPSVGVPHHGVQINLLRDDTIFGHYPIAVINGFHG